jgi:hypothetical protein
LGYLIAGEKGHKTHKVDENKKALMIKMFELHSTGNYSLSKITETMKQEGLRNEYNNPVSRTRMHELLSDPFYYGKIVWMGEMLNGKHEPLISKELFDLVQEKLSIKFGGKPKYRKHNFALKGKMVCAGCGGTISWEHQKGHWYGHCNHYRNCTQKTWVKLKNIEDQIFPQLNTIEPRNTRILEWLETALKEEHSQEIDYNNKRREELNNVIRVADLRMEGAYRDKLDHRMPVELCDKVIKESSKEKEEAIEALDKLSKNRSTYYRAGYSIHELAMRARDIYESPKATEEERRLLLTHIFSNLGLNEGKMVLKYTFGFEFLQNWIPKVNSTFEPAEISNSRGEKEKTDEFSSVCPVVRTIVDAVGTAIREHKGYLYIPDLSVKV